MSKENKRIEAARSANSKRTRTTKSHEPTVERGGGRTYLDTLDALNFILRLESFEDLVDDGLMQIRLGFDELCPDS